MGETWRQPVLAVFHSRRCGRLYAKTKDLQILNAAGASYHSPSPRRREDFMQTK